MENAIMTVSRSSGAITKTRPSLVKSSKISLNGSAPVSSDCRLKTFKEIPVISNVGRPESAG